MATSVIRTKEVVIEGIEKRTSPTKHYVYILKVEMSDKSTHRIHRRYNEFLKLQRVLSSLFSKESGTANKAERILPFIPGKAAYGKNHVRCTAIERLTQLEEFCKSLVQMPDRISQCHQVKEFFARRQDDGIYSESEATANQNCIPKSKLPGTRPAKTHSLTYRAREAYDPDGQHSKSQIALSVGEMVEVIEKLDTGWWYVEAASGQGWVPACCLEDPTGHYEDDTKIYATLGSLGGKPYVVSKCYQALAPDELTIKRGAIAAVLEKRSDGWWLVEFEGVRGMFPGCFLVRRGAAKGIRLVNELSKPDPSVNPSTSSKAQADHKTVDETSNKTTIPKAQPVPKPRRLVASPVSSPLPSNPPCPLPSTLPSQLPSHPPFPRPTPRQTNDSQEPSTKKDTSLESSSDEDESHSEVQCNVQSPPPREASLTTTKQTTLPGKETLTMERKVFRVRLDYKAVAPGTVSLTKGQEVQVMPRTETNGWMEVKIDGKRGFVPKECIEETKKLSPPRSKGRPKCELQDIEDAYWSGDSTEGERVLHSINKKGTFMIRKSQSNENQETLLVYEDGRILKYKIKHKQGCGYSLSNTDPAFQSFDELIFFYSANFLPKVATRLQVPYQRLLVDAEYTV